MGIKLSVQRVSLFKNLHIYTYIQKLSVHISNDNLPIFISAITNLISI